MTPNKAALLNAVGLAASAYNAARENLHRAVHSARERGASWSEIGQVLGTTRQAAYQRFGARHAASGSDA